jgi:hypothetical protein
MNPSNDSIIPLPETDDLFELDDDSEDDVSDESDVGRLQLLEEIEKEAMEMTEMLKADIPFARRIKSRLPRHLAALGELAQWCREVIDGFGLWRNDETDLEEICEAICEEAGSIARRLKTDHAMSFSLDGHELCECRVVAAALLASERFLTGAEVEILDEVVAGEIFDTRRLLEIVGNHGIWFRPLEVNEVNGT